MHARSLAVALLAFAALTGAAAQQPPPAFSVTPAAGPPGAPFTAAGSNYDPKCTVLLEWDVPRRLLSDPFQPNADGRFSVDVAVPTDAPEGSHRVRTTCEGADPRLSGFQPATATFTVTAPPPTTTTTSTSTSTTSTTSTTTTSTTTTTTTSTTTTTTTAAGPPPQAGTTAVATTTTTTTALVPPPDEDGGGIRRSVFAAAVRRPADVSTDLSLVAANAGLAALLVLLVAFPAELFNKTYEENEDEIRGWLAPLAPIGRPLRAVGGALARVPGLAFGLFAAAAAVLYAGLDPSFGRDASSLALVGGLLVAIVVATLAFEVPAELYVRWRLGRTGTIRVLPASLLIGAACVAVSRLASFEPGYLFGVVAGFAPLGAALPHRDEGRALAVAGACLLATSLVAWALWIPVASAAAGPDPTFATVLLDAALAGVFVAGLETLLFGLVPLRFLDGSKVVAWSRAAWLLLFATAAFAFVHVLLHPEAGYAASGDDGAFAAAAVLFVGFGAASVAFWAWFRYRAPQAPPTDRVV